jgi:hypothetical protein
MFKFQKKKENFILLAQYLSVRFVDLYPHGNFVIMLIVLPDILVGCLIPTQ